MRFGTRLWVVPCLLMLSAAVGSGQEKADTKKTAPLTQFTLGRAVGRLEAAVVEIDASFATLAKSTVKESKERLERWNVRKAQFKTRLAEIEDLAEKGGDLKDARKLIDSLTEDIKDWQVNAPDAKSRDMKAGQRLMILPGFSDYNLFGGYGWNGPIVVVDPEKQLEQFFPAIENVRDAAMKFRRERLGDDDKMVKEWLAEKKKAMEKKEKKE